MSAAAVVQRFKVVLPPEKGEDTAKVFYVGTAERVEEDQAWVQCKNVQAPRGEWEIINGKHTTKIVGFLISANLKFRKSDHAVLLSPIPVPPWFRLQNGDVPAA